MIIATAGHVDHGKTSLVRSLTGVDTDLLEEEKRRGLSINLGYAYWPQPEGEPIGFIDVPGHQRFVNTMISGVSGIDLGMLVVAADDGPMPQTLEHLDVLQLMGVKRYVLVVSKIDRADEARCDEVVGAVEALFDSRGVALDATLRLSNTTAEGVEGLSQYLQECAAGLKREQGGRQFRLSIDRCFSLKGAGLVVTGTAMDGQIEVGNSLHLLPQDKTVKVRSLHVQDQPADRAVAGARCAINISGDVEKDTIARGDWLLACHALRPSTRFDAVLQLLPHAPFSLKHLSPLRVHVGAKRVPGRVFLLDRSQQDNRLQPGNQGFAQLILDEPIVCAVGDHFLIRDDSESVTLGGGRVLDPHAPRSGKASDDRRQYLAMLQSGEISSAVSTLLEQQGKLPLPELAANWNLSPDQLITLIGDRFDEQHIDNQRVLISARAQANDDAEQASRQRKTLALNQRSDKRWRGIEQLLKSRGMDIPLRSQLVEETGEDARKLLASLGRAAGEGKLIELNSTRYALAETVAELVQMVLDMTEVGESLTVVNFKNRMGTGRKVAIEVLEYFDSVGFTRRCDDHREIVDHSVPQRLFREQ